MITAAAMPTVADVLCDKWRLDALLGEGGMAMVFAATHRNGRRAAVKVLLPALAGDPDVRERFRREAYAANRIDHPGAVAVFDDDVDPRGVVFLVMELLEGSSLEDLASVQDDNRLPPSAVARFALGLLDVLAAAHRRGVVHRDIKPANVFLTRAGEVKVLDFGIARVGERVSSASATQTGAFMGTPAFCAPEQAQGLWNEVDHRTDLWAVGATMFALLTGHPVHDGATANQVLLAAMTAAAPPVTSLCPSLPPSLAAVVDRALARDPADRYASALEMRHALALAIDDATFDEEPTIAIAGAHSPRTPATVREAPFIATPHVGDTSAPVTAPLMAPTVARHRRPASYAHHLGGLVAAAAIVALVAMAGMRLAGDGGERAAPSHGASSTRAVSEEPQPPRSPLPSTSVDASSRPVATPPEREAAPDERIEPPEARPTAPTRSRPRRSESRAPLPRLPLALPPLTPPTIAPPAPAPPPAAPVARDPFDHW